MGSSSDRLIPTPTGDARVVVDAAADPWGTFVAGHGAGGGAEARDLAALAAALPARGLTVVRVEQPWRVAGKRIAPAPSRLDTAWVAVLEALRDELTGRLVVAGRSAGARVACRTARRVGAAGVVALAFPLHPPGRPAGGAGDLPRATQRSRVEELLGTGVPTLVVQGERDAFGAPEEFPPEVELRRVPAADHGFAVPRSADLGQQEALNILVDAVAGWLEKSFYP
ncbi:alpha/beta hydrolase family protein [Carbonactinospora thermoautotrophica]|uniref:alpha/beta hydrolase family protein n=1 Tax=Carbonactinospora thermoautotrophica TaxID=1469144 RepID=UPI003557A6F2